MIKSTNSPHLSDEELLLSYKKSGNKIYMEELFFRYLPLLYGVCLKYLKNSDRAREAVMQFFDGLLYKIKDYKIDIFRPWVYNAIKKHCSQILQREGQAGGADFNDENVKFKDIMPFLEGDQDKNLMSFMNLPGGQQVSITFIYK